MNESGASAGPRLKAPPTPLAVTVLGAPRAVFRDLYHRFLRASWPVALAAIVVTFLTLNAIFASFYLLTGGIANARPGSFADAFSFSVQTMATIGYGSMYPSTGPAQTLVVAQAVVGLLVTAVVTGLVFSKFSQASARILFTREAVITPFDGVPTLMFRVSNERGNQIVEAVLRVTLVRTEKTREGITFYKMYDLALSRERSAAFSRSWTVMHPIVPGSLLYGETPETMKAKEVELIASLVGTDDTSMQTVHARHTYTDDQVRWGMRHADILSEVEGDRFVLDLRKFHDLVRSEPTEDFPYPEVPGRDPHA
jgi:inward rectifier potassium channel